MRPAQWTTESVETEGLGARVRNTGKALAGTGGSERRKQEVGISCAPERGGTMTSESVSDPSVQLIWGHLHKRDRILHNHRSPLPEGETMGISVDLPTSPEGHVSP